MAPIQLSHTACYLDGGKGQVLGWNIAGEGSFAILRGKYASLEDGMTSLRRQLDRAFLKIEEIKERLEDSGGHPPCCLIFHENNRISCDMIGPMQEEAFSTFCRACRNKMKTALDRLYPDSPDT
ncbi:hypothetical protein KAU25_05265 [Candidatus Bathyarchaeota archaeon]|nr:hypothetical protein [Candidatus Bathyarchaeota archaeon]